MSALSLSQQQQQQQPCPPSPFFSLLQEDVSPLMQELQMRDIFRTFNEISETCFRDCVTSFRQKELTPGEECCINRCTAKYLKFMQRSSARFVQASTAADAAFAESS